MGKAKFFQIFQLALPLTALIPGVGPVLPSILAGVLEAQALHGEQNDEAKRQHVFNIVAAGAAGSAAATKGKVNISPDEAIAITKQVFGVVDAMKQTINDARQATQSTAAILEDK